ncbi:extracellular solute-binding protein [Streptomyces sp. NBC_01498]|uniref:extracellular solute-binding protein n=1 Tax=Streptomyces sp. NBC_01498 TaxID=2975870 RepID=UPI002E7BD6D5|nr:extracellular solute-binding protein [Streptomyces sp. NBC_01498]WTL23507.1 extracellular solute-binding protein [Streptomyces sp. NBC_01498]
MKNRFLVGSAVFVSSLAFVGCGMLPGEDDKVITVWLMKDSVSGAYLDRFTEAYEKDNPSVELEVKIQEWTGIGKKVMAALDSENPPDVIEVGNTQVAQYAESDGLRDLTLESVRDLGSEDWLPGLAEPGSINGSQYGIPWYAANRVVIYNKEIFAEAGIEELPRTRDEWLDMTAELDKGSRQGIYLAGQDWYTLAGFIWDEKGELAAESGGEWEGRLNTPAAIRGMEFYQELQALGDGPKDSDEVTPVQEIEFAKGDIAQMIDTPNSAVQIEEKNPALKGKLGFFPIPGKTAAKPGSVFTGGSDLIVPKNSSHRSAAVDVVKALAGEKWQTDLAKTMSYVPNKTTLADAIQGHEATSAMAAGAAQGRATPNSPKWANVELDNPIKRYMTAVLQGEDPEIASEVAVAEITAALR